MIAKALVLFVFVGMLARAVCAENATGPSSQTDLEIKLRELRKTHPTGLLVVEAKFGAQQQWKDVTSELQAVASDDSLTVPVSSKALGDATPNVPKELVLTYAIGSALKTLKQSEGTTAKLGRASPRSLHSTEAFSILTRPLPRSGRRPRRGC